MKLNKRIFIWLMLFLLVPLLCFVFRDIVLQWAFRREKLQIEQVYHCMLNAKNIRFSGFREIEIDSLSIQSEGMDTLLTFGIARFNLLLPELLTGKIALDDLQLQDLAINLPDSWPDNFYNIRGKKFDLSVEQQKSGAKGYLEKVIELKSKLDRLFALHFDITNIHITYKDSNTSETLFCPEISNNEHLSARLINLASEDTLSLDAGAQEGKSAYRFVLHYFGTKPSYLPFLDRENGLKCTFRGLDVEVHFEAGPGEQTISTAINAENFQVQYWRLSGNPIGIKTFQFKGKIRIGPEAIELDSSSVFQMDNTGMQLYASYLDKPEPVAAMHLYIPELSADTFFRSLPTGAFNSLNGISCAGTLSYHLEFAVNTAQPDSLVFISYLKTKNLHINHFGEENFTRINEPFTYDAYNGKNLVRRILIGPGNPAFTPLNQINHWLPTCIMQSEDPSFMSHRGFVPEAFRESIIQNYKEKRFARGGSTLSMQLVKNVFLKHEKTVARKAEEALDVYLIENLALVSKERMLEVYLNAIEWGPDVYGIGEASRFYFNKAPSQLSLKECIFLAWLIPHPKSFKYQFDKEGNVKPYFDDYFRLILQRLVMRGFATEADTLGLTSRISLTGPARRLIVPGEDTTAYPENEDEEMP